MTQYGWTPARLAAAATAAIVALYAVTYALAVVLRGPWMARIRQANILAAVVVFLVAAAWQTPVLNAEFLSTRSQVARIENGTSDLADMAFYELAHDWGKPGQVGVEQLKDGAAQTDAALQAALLRAETASSSWQFERGQEGRGSDALAAQVHAHLTVVPEGDTVDVEMLQAWPHFRLRDWAVQCAAPPDPGCVLVLGRFLPEDNTRQGIMFIPAQARNYDVYSLYFSGEALSLGEFLTPFGGKEVTVTQVRSILQGRYEVAPSSRRSLWIGDLELFPDF